MFRSENARDAYCQSCLSNISNTVYELEAIRGRSLANEITKRKAYAEIEQKLTCPICGWSGNEGRSVPKDPEDADLKSWATQDHCHYMRHVFWNRFGYSPRFTSLAAWKTLERITLPNEQMLSKAHKVFIAKEQRHREYDRVSKQIELAIEESDNERLVTTLVASLGSRSKSEKIALREKIRHLLNKSAHSLVGYRTRDITSLDHNERSTINTLFEEFEREIGAVRAATMLHLMAPRFSPFWNEYTPSAYGVEAPSVAASDHYFSLMSLIQWQINQRGALSKRSRNFLKLLEEHNYCKYLKDWIK